jgi:predicted amidophosphoribosyltransferase
MKNRGPHVCPNCGERVTAFAAGCALCGARLDPHRAQRPWSRGRQILLRVAGRRARAAR